MAKLPHKHFRSPPPEEVREARRKTGLTCIEAGALIYESGVTWSNMEKSPSSKSHQWMHPAQAELFALKTGLIELPPITRKILKYKEGWEKRRKNLVDDP